MATIPESLIQKRLVNGRQVLFFNNREAYLAGVYPDIANLDGAQGDRSRADKADFRPRMEFLADNTNNFFRHWVTFYPLFVYRDERTKQCDPKRSFTSGNEPFAKRYSPFLYVEEEGKSDLFRFNEDFFYRLRRMIETALEYRIIVQLTVFDRTGLSLEDCSRWPYNPWNADRNINEVIQTGTEENGVNKFYQRELPGKIRVPKIRPRPRPRPWDDDDGGDIDPGDFVLRNTTLGALQDGYARKVVSETVKYPNVVYEIMNEPFAGGQAGDVPARVKWNDTMLGVIYEITQGKRLIFYNELQRGDVALWRKSKTTANYSKLDGVTFHGDAKKFNPTTLGPDILREKVIQVSTDTHIPKNNPDEREQKDYNRAATTHAFANHMMFQAEAVSAEAAAGISEATPSPTLFFLPELVGKWIKVADPRTRDNLPHLVYAQNPDGTLANINQDNDVTTLRGRVVKLTANKIAVRNDVTNSVGSFTYDLVEIEPEPPHRPRIPSRLRLEFTGNKNVQVFRKLGEADPLYRFFFQWQRISVTPPSKVPPFFAFFYPDKTLISRRVDNFEVNNRAKITNITPTQLFVHSDTMNNDTVWNYSFSSDGRRLTLEKADRSMSQVFQRVV